MATLHLNDSVWIKTIETREAIYNLIKSNHFKGFIKVLGSSRNNVKEDYIIRYIQVKRIIEIYQLKYEQEITQKIFKEKEQI